MFGRYMPVCFDIDYEEDGLGDVDESLDKVLKHICKELSLQPDQLEVVNRCRDKEDGTHKTSYHIRVPGFIINRIEL
jgi:hypothetical protein